jgi:hypothetical protein
MNLRTLIITINMISLCYYYSRNIGNEITTVRILFLRLVYNAHEPFYNCIIPKYYVAERKKVNAWVCLRHVVVRTQCPITVYTYVYYNWPRKINTDRIAVKSKVRIQYERIDYVRPDAKLLRNLWSKLKTQDRKRMWIPFVRTSIPCFILLAKICISIHTLFNKIRFKSTSVLEWLIQREEKEQVTVWYIKKIS